MHNMTKEIGGSWGRETGKRQWRVKEREQSKTTARWWPKTQTNKTKEARRTRERKKERTGQGLLGSQQSFGPRQTQNGTKEKREPKGQCKGRRRKRRRSACGGGGGGGRGGRCSRPEDLNVVVPRDTDPVWVNRRPLHLVHCAASLVAQNRLGGFLKAKGGGKGGSEEVRE